MTKPKAGSTCPLCVGRYLAVWTLVATSGWALPVHPACAQETVPAGTPEAPRVTAPPPPAALSESEIAAAILDLGHDEFPRREAATRALMKSGVAAVKPLAAAAEQEDLEVAVRALLALEAIFRADDDVANEAAEQEIERLAQSKSMVIAERSQAALEGLVAVREQRAIRSLVRMGAEVERSQDLIGGVNRVFVAGRRDTVQPWNALIGEEWTGKDEGLTHLRRIVTLIVVYITPGAKVSQEAFERLEREFPGKVQKRGAAMLGIAAETDANGCLINRVTEGGPADDAGIEKDDRILLYDNEGITNFEQVISRTFDFPPGRIVLVTVLRRDEILNIPVKLERFSLKPMRAPSEPEGRGR
jgi:hypothetical protein